MMENIKMKDLEKDLCNPGTLRSSISEVFDSMIFMEVSPESDLCENLEEQYCIMGSISFTGIFEGSLSFRCSMECAKEITMNLLAFEDEEEMEESDIPDAIGEVANMTMGTIKSKLYEYMGEISVSAPTVITGAGLVNRLRAGEVKLSATLCVNGKYCIQTCLLYVYSGE